MTRHWQTGLMRWAWSLLLVLSCPVLIAEELKTLKMDSPIQPDSPYSLFVGELLGTAYASLGYRLELESMPLGRSFIEADEGRLDGLRDRGQSIANAYPHLIQVPFPLYDFNLVLLADRRRCGLCELSDMNSLVTLRGFQFQEDYFSALAVHPPLIKLGDTKAVLDMLTLKRVDAAVLTELIVPPSFYQSSDHWIQYPLDSASIFHYLHAKHTTLARKLASKLEEMELTGEVWQLRQKYGIPPIHVAPSLGPAGKISAISGSWQGYTDTPQATYWRMLRRAFAEQRVEVETQPSNWKRAKQAFAEGRFDMLIGAYAFEIPPGALLSDVHIDYEYPVVAVGTDAQSLALMLDRGEPGKACHVLGYEFVKWLPVNIEIYETSTVENCLKLLQNQRVDMLVDFSYNLTDEELTGFAQREIKEALPLFVAFQNSNRGHLLKKIFEQGFRDLVASGEVADYFPDQFSYRQARLTKSP